MRTSIITMWSKKLPPASLLVPFFLLHLLWTTTVHAREEKKGPSISQTKLDNPPANFFYFDDSEIILIHDRDAGIILRSVDAGKEFKKVDDIAEGKAWDVQPHPFNPKVAYALGETTEHWITNDQGESWTKFKTDAPPSLFKQPLGFHATDSNKVLLHTQECKGIFDCEEQDYYTTDGFKSVKPLRKNTSNCIFVHSTLRSEVDEKDLEIPEDRVVCVVIGRDSPYAKDFRVVFSDDYFKDGSKDGYEPYLDGDRTVKGIIKMAMVKGYLVAAAKAEHTAEMALYVTKDAKTWHRAEFPKDHKLEEDAYTILESTNYSIQVDVMTTKPSNPMGVLFTSNSNGTYFARNIEHTNRNRGGNVDFEKIQGIQGIVLVNIVENWQDVARSSRANKKVKTKISFHDGRNFEPITYDKKELHLHSVTDISNFFGRIYSSSAPGIVMGVGNTGDYLRDYEEGDLYVSDDAGLTWNLALKEAHKYEFGDQGAVLMAIYDEGPTNEISYSIDHGKTWDTAALVDGDKKVRAKVLTTTPDSTSLKFVLLATIDRKDYYVFSIDFEGLHERKCEKDDFEDWHARPESQDDPGCVMGEKQWYRRRKADAKCFVGEKFEDPVAQFDECPCTNKDFECDYNYNFKWDGPEHRCVPAGTMPVPSGQCEKGDDKYKGSSGYRLIPGNKCKDGVNLEQEIERDCRESKKAPVSGKISAEITSFRGKYFMEHYYLERAGSSSGTDQTVIMRTNEKEIYISRDHGKVWTRELEGKEITAIYPHQYFNDAVFFLTGGKTVHYTTNRGATFDSFTAEASPTRDKVQIMGFHEDRKDWLLWTGAVDCSSSKNGECHSVTFYSTDRGDHWETLARYVRKCEFIKKEGRPGGDKLEKLVYCEQFEGEKLGGPLQLLSSNNWFGDREVKFPDVIDFATMSEFIIVAAKDSDQKSLKIDTSMDGRIFADALFPKNLEVPHQTAYTVLDSSTHAIFLHVTVEDRPNFEYGSIVKSNSNGTSYVLSLDGVNRNEAGFADFEKMLGLQGVALTNVVANREHPSDNEVKKLKSMITHNDGAQWALLPAPEKDAEGHDFECDIENIDSCSLHLHAYTERDDPRKTFSSPSAIGLMMGVGNVGEHLTRKSDGDLFLTRDGGVTWNAVKKGNYMWEYGDQGSILVIVKENVATKVVYYSRDEGDTWTEYQFSESEMNIFSISTVPSDNSRNFLLWGKDTHSDGKIVTVNLDFTGLTDRQCKLMLDDLNSDERDYELWTPKHPLQDDSCLFGKVAQYHRKKRDRDCYNGPKIPDPHTKKYCACTRQDFEWYVPQSSIVTSSLQ